MREILFRGKRSDNGEWSEGSSLYDSEQNESYIAECFEDKAAYLREVVPETVGQFTGLIDKNGKKIFEGDIVKHYNRIYIGEPDSCIVVLIEWNEEEHRYQQRKKDGECFLVGKQCFFEIIGNIHDNPELLKGGEAE